MATKKYIVIYADPPWQQKAGRKMAKYKIVDNVQIWNSEAKKVMIYLMTQ